MAISATISAAATVTLLLCCLTISGKRHALQSDAQPSNNRPVIGILTQEISYKLNEAYPGLYASYIAASYVKFVEGAGARVVPIWIGRDEAYYNRTLRAVNGVLWPGGATRFNQTGGYADAGEIIYKIAKALNNNGIYFPIFAICLGYEMMTYLEANRVEHRVPCSSQQQALPLQFYSDFQDSRMFHDAPLDVVTILQGEPVTANFHSYCVTTRSLSDVGVRSKFRVMSSNRDENNLKFISSLEHTDYPFYGVQFHPEKNMYEWRRGKNIPHGQHATRASQFFADFFVNEARRNGNQFPKEEVMFRLIYNYEPTYTALRGSSYYQCYFFTEADMSASTFSLTPYNDWMY